MSGSDTEILVQVTAETAQLQAGMEKGVATVASTTEAMSAAVTEAAAATAVATKAIGESAEEAAARIKAMVAASMEQQAVNGGIAESERSIAERMGQRIEMTQAQAAAIAKAIAAQDAQMVSVSAYVGAEAEAVAVTEASTVAVTENTGAMVLNARVSGELGTMLGEVMTGNFGRLRRSAGALANQSGLLAKAFTPIGMAALAAGGAVFAFADAVIKGAEEQAKYNAALLVTGGNAGVTSSAVQQMAQQVGESTGSFGKASEAMLAIVNSGRFTADELQAVGTAAVQMSKLTGDSVEQSVEVFVKLQEKPVEAVVVLNEKYHFLTASVFDQIEALNKQGDTQGAAKVAMDAYAASLEQRTSEAESQLGTLARSWDSVKASASFAWDAMLGVGREETIDDKIARLQAQLVVESGTHLGQPRPLARFNSKEGEVGWESTGENPAVAVQIAQLKALQAAKAQADGAAKQKGDDNKAQQQTIAAIQAQEKFNASLKDTSHLEDAIAEAKQRAEQIHKIDPGSDSIKGINFDASGAITGGEQWTATIAKLTKEYSNAGTEARKASQEAKKAAAEQMNDLEMVRAGTAANTAERIQADAAILASATRLYGANSSQQEAALTRMLADEKAYDAEVLKERQQAIQDQTAAAMSTAQSHFALKQQEIQRSFALGETKKQEELAQLAAANDEEYRLESQLLNKELALLDVKSKAHERVNLEIQKLQQRHELEMQKISEQAAKANQQMWQQRLAPINRAFQQSIQGMIMHTQTFRQGLDRILQSILASYIQTGLQMVTHWASTELAKTTATTVGAASRATVEATAATASKAADAATGKSQITSAAATGAAKAYQAIVGIPYVGPILAPIAAGVAFAGIEAFSGMVSSAQGGWERVPIDGAMTELHKDEMVLPAHVANPIRDMAKKGGQGGQGGGQVHIHATDARSFKDMLRRNPAALAGALKQAGRMGHFGGAR
jgi:phage-related minor tail protein